jgi:tRNA (cytidine/uridine-2'-O-)-methyltransferase
MLDIVLYQPEIPPNTGNIIRLCANTGFTLHLIAPLGFDLEDKIKPNAVYGLSTKGKKCFSKVRYQPGDCLLFGPETRGLPVDIRQSLGEDKVIRLPMQPDSRSLNLSNAVSIVTYEAWRQLDFNGSHDLEELSN